jgi:hypothetical protein
MVFFQTVLLVGYAYAHLVNRLLAPLRAAMLHLALVGITALTLPIAIAPGWGIPPSEGTALWLFGLFAASIGLPFFTLSASAPLLQSWFAASGHRQAGNPYVLYAASNLGSFAALFAYPVIVEPFLTLKTQAAIWSIGFALLAMLLAVAGLLTVRAIPAAASVEPVDVARATAGERMRWIALAAVPWPGHRVTAHLTTDIAGAVLWVVPRDLPARLRRKPAAPGSPTPPWCALFLHSGAARGQPHWRRQGVLGHDDRPQPGGLCAADADVPRRTLCAAPEPAAVDGVLSVHVAGRRDRRRVCRLAGAADLQRQLRISDPDRAGAVVRARNLRKWFAQGAGRSIAVAPA